MSERDERDTEAEATSAAEEPAEGQEQDGCDDVEQDQDEQPKITLDRYLSQRRAPPRSGIPQLVAAVVMLVTLVMIVLYKDRCGQAVSGLMGDMEGPAQPAGTPARIEIRAPDQQQK